MEQSTIVDVLLAHGVKRKDHLAYLYLEKGEEETSRVTFGQLRELVLQAASQVAGAGLTGKTVLLAYDSSLEFVVSLCACFVARALAVPVYLPRRNQNLHRFAAVVEDSGARHVLVSEAAKNRLEGWMQSHERLHELEWICTGPGHVVSAELPKLPAAEDLAFLQYTSGSTALPRGVMVSHDNIIANQEIVKESFDHDSNTVFVGWLPLFHDMGLIGNVLQPLYLGIPCILMPPEAFLQKPLRWLRAISRYRGTTSGAPNFAYELCLRTVSDENLKELDLSCWKVAFNGAEPVRAEVIEAFADRFAPCGFRSDSMFPCYGMAETTLMLTGGPAHRLPRIQRVEAEALGRHRIIKCDDHSSATRSSRIVSCGQSWQYTVVEVVNPQTYERCREGEIGEIWAAGRTVTVGYWKQPAATIETFKAQILGEEGYYLRTGDLGYFDGEELFVTGRLKDLIIIRGRNYYPQDLEYSGGNSHPAISGGIAAAFTVDTEGSEKLVLVHELGFAYRNCLIGSEVIASVRQQIAEEFGLRIEECVLVKRGSIPRTSSGKVQRSRCKEMYLRGELQRVPEGRNGTLSKVPSELRS